ncbi:hemagglutinin repeat-containing protein [Vibrio rhizosphaerae]|uniref:Hemagglutinin repeat-containing protein n=1 Tax=Vibrio rhizosphaerae TaxID=398736 RepID=A0ABU4IW20_9VIBR|nr:hemagglutinin repeat-containing protein [Vibrio rhizosphaerae]MDW6092418.1 hemagglutinin repeat-containing protein [Vibrio rhizosphaerae]
MKNMIKPVTFWQRALVYFICWTFNIQPLLANVIVDNSQHNTSVNRAGNGVEVVNIATPNANGLSHNQYQQFNVDPSGLILNNSTAQVAQSQLGGYLQNNPNLHGQAATVILNEVTGASRSQLQGYTEVFGQGAPVILTNPYGITCNGCGFINTPRVTLSTGNPLIENGNVTGFDVSQGSVSIEGLGLDATHQSYFDIITRTAQLNADIHANDLSIVTGKNRVSYQSNQVTATTADDKEAAPELAIDSSNLGGMYAGRIALVATDAGVGVNVGNLSASQGDIRISADGQITLGKSSAQNNLTVSSQSGVTLKGSQYAGQTASLSGQRIHADSNTLAAGQNVSLTATDTVTLNQSLVEAGVDADGKQQAGGVVDVQANNLTLNAGNLIAGQQLTTAVDHITVDQDSLIYGQKMALNQLSKLDNSGTVAAKDQLSVKGTDASLVGHGNMTASEITMDSDRLTLDTHITAQTLAVQASQNLTTGEQSEVSATDKLTVTAGTLNQQGQLTTRGDMDINAADAILKGDVAAQDIQVKAQHLTQESGTLQAGQTLHITGDMVTLSGASAGKNSVGIDAGQLTLNGTLQSGGDTHLTVVNDMQTREQSQLVTQGSLQATVGTLTQRGKMQSGEDVTLTGHTLKNEGLVSAVGNTHLTAQAQLTNRGTVTSGQQLTTNAGAVTSSGELSAQQKVAMTVAGQLDNQTNGLISGQVTTVQAGSVNNAGQLQSLTDLGLTADALNNSGTLAALSDTTLNVTHDLTNRGAVSAGHDVRLLTDNLTNSGQVIANDNLLIAKDLNQTRNTSLNNTGGSLDAGSGSLTIATQGDLQVSAGQHLFAGKDLTVTAATLNNSGEIAAQNKTRLTLDGVTTGQPVLTNQTGGLISGQSTSIDAQSVANHGQLQALGDLGLTATSLANSGTLTALNTTLAVHDHLLNTGTVSAVENISLLADQVDNQGRVSAGTHLLIAADQDNKRSDSLNNAGRVETRNGDIEIVTDAMTQQSSGHMIAGQDFRLDGNQLDNGGELAATGKTDLLLHQQLLNQQSGLISGQVTAITAQSVNNQGQLQSLSDLGLTAESFGNSGVLAALDNTSLHISHDLTSSGSILAGHQIVLNAEQLDNRGRVSAGDAAIATPATGQDDSLIVTADTLTNSGELLARGRNQLTLNMQLTNQTDGLISGQTTTVNAQSVTNHGQLQSLTDLGLTADALNNSGTLAALSDMTLNVAHQLSNNGAVSASHDVSLLTDNLTNTGKVFAGNNLLIAKDSGQTRTTTFNNTDGSLTAKAGHLTIATHGDVVVSAGQHLTAGQNVTLQASSLTNDGEVSAQGKTALTLDNALTNHGLVSGQQTTLAAQSVTNTGQLQSLTDLGLTADALANSGTLAALSDMTLNVAHQLSNSGAVLAGSNIHLNATKMENRGRVSAGDQALMTADQQAAGRTDASLSVIADTLTNSGELLAQGSNQLTLNTQLTNQTDGLISGQITTVNAPVVTNAGQLQSLTDLGLTADALANSGTLAALSDMTLNVAHQLSNSGAVSADHDVSLLSDNLTNTGKVFAGNNLLIAKDSEQTRNTIFNNTDGSLTAKAGHLTIATHDNLVVSTGQHLTAGQDLSLQANSLTNDGEVSAQGKTALILDNTLTNHGLVSGQQTTLAAQSVTNTGQLQSLTTLGLTADALANSGTLAALSDMTLNVTHQLSNNGAVSASHDVSLLTDNLTNIGKVFAGNNLLIAKDSEQTRTATFNNTDGSLTAKAGQLTIATHGDVLVSAGQHLTAGQDLSLQANSLTNNGEVSAQGNTSLTLDNALTNHGLVSGQQTTLAAQSVTNTGQLQSLTDLGLTADALNNSGTLAALSDMTLNVAHQLSNNGAVSASHDVSLLTDNLTNTGKVFAGNNLLIAKDSEQTRNTTFNNTDGSLTAKAGQLRIATHDNLVVSAGQHLTAGQDLSLQANSLINDGEVSAQGNTSLTLDNALTNHGLVSGQQTTLAAQSVTNTGQLQSLTDLGLTADALANSGTLAALSDMTLNVAHQLSNNGAVSASHDVSLLTDNLTNTGKVFAGNNLLIAKDSEQTRNTTFNNTDGSLTAKAGQLRIATHDNLVVSTGQHLTAGQDLSLQANSLTNNGEVSAQGNTSLTLDNTLTNHGLVSGQQTTVTAQSVNNTGQMQALTDLGLNADVLANSGTLVAGNNAVFNIIHTLTSNGNISAGNNASLLADQVNNQNKIYARNSVLIAKDSTQTRSSSLTNSGQIDAKHGSISIATHGDFTVGAGQHLSAGKDLTLVADALTNDGELSSQGITTIGVDGTLTNHTAGIISGQNTVLRAGATTNQGQLQALNDLNLTTGSLTNSGSLVALHDMTLNATGYVDNHSLLYAGHDGNLFSDSLTNYSDIVVGNDLLIARDSNKTRSRNLTNSSGNIESLNSNISIYTDSLVNKRTVIQYSKDIIYTDYRPLILSISPFLGNGDFLTRFAMYMDGFTNLRNRGFLKYNHNDTFSLKVLQKGQTISDSTDASNIRALGNIYIQTKKLINDASVIYGGSVNIDSNEVDNLSYKSSVYTVYYDYKSLGANPRRCMGEISDGCPHFTYIGARDVVAGTEKGLSSSIIAQNNLSIHSTTLNNTSIIQDSTQIEPVNKSTYSVKSTHALSDATSVVRSTQSAPDTEPNLRITQQTKDSRKNFIYNHSETTMGEGVLTTQEPSDTSAVQAQSAATHSIELTSQGSELGAAVQAGQTSTGSGLAAQSAPNLTSVARTAPQGKPTTTVPLSNSSTVTAPTVNLPNQNRIPFPDYRLPTSPHGLFVFSDGPQSDYLIATNPAVTNLNDFLGSDYFKDQLNYDPERKEKFLGDAYYDTRTISQEIFEQTGKRYLNEDIGSDLAQMKQLIDSAAQEKTALNLKNGVALTDEQIARLSHDIIWYEPIEVNGQTVMAPKLYLSSASQDNISNGALLAGRNVNVTTGDFANSGAVAAREDLSIASRNGISNTHGTLSANDDLALIATGDIVNRSGVISGGNVQLKTTSGNVVNETLVNKTDYGNGFVHTEVGPESLIQSRTTLGVSAGKDIVSKGATIRAGEGTVLLAGGDVTFGAVERETQQSFLDGGTRQVIKDIVHLGSTVSSGGDLTIQAGNNFHATASDLSAQGTLILAAGHDITLDTAVDTAYRYSDGGGHTRQLSTTTNQGSNLSGRDVLLQSGNDTTLVNGGIQASGNVALNAKGDVNILAANDSRYEYSKSTHKKSFGRSKTTIHESLKETVRGSSIAAGGDITIKAQKYSNAKLANGHSDIQVVGSNLNAGDAINLSADGDVILSAQQYREYQYNQTIKKGFGGLSGSNRGNLDDATLLEGANTIAASHININSGKNIGVIASTVSAGGDVNMQALDEVLVTADNILRQTQQWDEKSSFLSGGHLMEMSSDREGMQSSTAQGSQIASHGNVNIQGGSVALVGSDVGAGENTVLKADTGHLDIRSAQNSLRKTSQHKQVSVDFPTFELLSHPESALQITDGQVRFRIGKATYDQVENQTTATTQTGSTILANNDVSLSATGDLTVTGSRIAADQDGSGAGDLSLAAENILIQEAKETEQTQSQEVHGKAEASLVVQHQAVEVAKAVKGLQQATQALKQAKQDYQQYKKQLASLKGTLETLQADYAAKKPGVMFEDIEELQDLVSDLKGDEAWYAAGIALAAENVTSKTTLLAKQSDAAVNSITSGAFGFDAGLHLDIDADKQNSQSQRVTSVGSQLSGQNVTIEAGHQTGQSATVQGSVIHADDTLAVSGNQVNLLASDEQSSNTNGSESAHVGASVTLFGANSGVNLDASYSRNESVSQSQTHTNSVLSADHIRITSDGDTDVNGADVAANEQLDISVGGDLNVASVQNRYSSTNHGGSVSGGVGLSGGDVGKGGAVSGFDHAGNLQGVNSGVNLSNGRSHSRETMLTRITSGGDANITVGGNTDIKGATIATVNEDGSDAGRLHLKTGTLSYTDLSNTRDTSSRNAGVSSSVSIGPDKDGATQIDASRNSSRYQYTNQSGYYKSKTLATVGQGVLRIEDTRNSDDTERLNRDVTSTTKDLFSVDRQQGNFDVTVDHRLLSETGRAQVKEDFKRNAITGSAIADTVTKKSVGLLSDDDSGVSSLREHVGQKQGFFTAVKTFVTSDDNQAYVETLNNPTATPAQKEAAYQALSASVAEQFGLNPAQVMTALVNTANGQPVKGAYAAGKVLINDAAHYRLEDIVNTIGHETQHYLDDAQSTGTHNDAYKANREEYADTMGEATEDYVGFNFANTGRGDFGGWNLQRGTNHSDLVQENTQTAAPLLRDPTIDYRQPNADERTAILALAGNDKRRQQELKEAACALTHCSAEYAVGTEKYNEMKALEEAGASNPEAQEVLLKYSFLKVADNMNMATVVDKLFGYTDSDVRTDRYQAGMDQGTENSLKAFNEAYGTNITKEQFESGVGFLSGLAAGFGAAKGGKYTGAATAEDAAAYKALKGIGEKADSVSSLSTEGLSTSGKTLSREEASIISRGNSGGSVAGASSTESGPLLLEYKPGVADKSKLPVVVAETPSVNRGSLAGVGSSSSSPAAAIGEGTVLARNNHVSSESTDVPEYTYRGDSREPDIIFNEGFQTRGNSTDLLAHALDNTKPPSNYIPTSKSADVAADFDPDYIYVVRPVNGIDVNKTLGADSPFPTELEIAIPNGVAPKDIRAVTLPDQQVSILNPNYKK